MNNNTVFFRFGNSLTAQANKLFTDMLFKNFWYNGCCSGSTLTVRPTDCFVFCTENAMPDTDDCCYYTLSVTETGIALYSGTKSGLLQGFFTLLSMIRPECLKHGAEVFSIPCCILHVKERIKTRFLHLCYFPETDLHFLDKVMTLAAAVGRRLP